MICAFDWTRWSVRRAGVVAVILIATTLPAWSEDPSLAPDVLVRQVLADVLAAIKNAPSSDREGREKALVLAKQKIIPHVDFKRMTRDFSSAERRALFHDNAARFYRL